MRFPFWNNFFFCLRYIRVSSLVNRTALVEDLLNRPVSIYKKATRQRKINYLPHASRNAPVTDFPPSKQQNSEPDVVMGDACLLEEQTFWWTSGKQSSSVDKPFIHANSLELSFDWCRMLGQAVPILDEVVGENAPKIDLL